MNFQPVLLKNRREANELTAKNNADFTDLLPAQSLELYIINNLSKIVNKADIPSSPEFKTFCDEQLGRAKIFYYPWLNRIIQTLDQEHFFCLKTNRNQDLITGEEQKKLSEFTVAVLGLSVGSNIAFLLTQAGISNKIFLADPDNLDTTNLNRIFTGVQDLGLNKSILAARKIYEGNPFAEVTPIQEGINPGNLEELLKTGVVNCIIEEVDSLPIKITTRKLALKYKVPVMMITDNGFSVILHVERYDLGYSQIFEKDAAYWDSKISGGLDIQKVSQIIVEDIIGDMQKIDPKLIASTMRIFQKELVSWPQLGSTAMLGGVVVTQALKKIALGENKEPFIKRFIHAGV
jgi:molybdopterin/thiamine biosynthesis adenylyltransferase